MAKPSKKKSYTQDEVLNKILQDIANENVASSSDDSNPSTLQNDYEDELIKYYRDQDARQSRQKKLKILMIIAVLLVMFMLLFIITNSSEKSEAKPLLEAVVVETKPIVEIKEEKIETPVIVEPVKEKPQPLKKTTEPVVEEKPVKRVKTEREIAKERLLQQMKN